MESRIDEQTGPRSESIHARLVLLYLGLPTVIFLGAFVDLALSLPILALVGSSLYLELRPRPESGRRFDRVNWPATLIGAGAGLFVLLVVGFPGGPFAWDWVKHWALLNALAGSEWPTVLDLGGVPHHLRFYLGAYLVPAAFIRLLGIPAWLGFGAWLWLGYALVAAMAARRAAGRSWLAVLGTCALFLAIAGADIWMMTLLRNLSGAEAMPMLGTHAEWWLLANFGLPVQYSSILAALVWVPHQSIATFLVADGLLDRDEVEDFPANLLAYGLLALWSPFGMIGLLPVLALRTWRSRTALFAPRVVAAGAAATSFAFLMAASLAGGAPGRLACLGCLPTRLTENGPTFLLFLAAELAVFAVVLGTRLVRDPICLISLAILFVLPLIGGDTPDLVMRVSLGPLCILSLATVQRVAAAPGEIRLALCIALLLCVPTALGEVVYQRSAGRAHHDLALRAPGDPLASRWYFAFAPSSRITMDQYTRLVPPTEWGQYFTTTAPSVYQKP